MSEDAGASKHIPPGEVITAAVGSLLPPAIAVFLIVKLVLSIQSSHVNMDDPVNQDKAVRARIAPVGVVNVRDANQPQAEKTGEEVYQAVCSACHGSGALGAPKLNARADWAGRIGKGLDRLLKSAISGKKAMPARGGNPDLTDGELARAIAFMANSAGAHFQAPEAKTGAAKPVEAGSPPAAASVATGSAKADGKTVYEGTCIACHGAGVAGAPKVGDKAAWAPRIKGGVEKLMASATKGKNAMPPRGGNAGLSDAQIKAAVEYMVGQSK